MEVKKNIVQNFIARAGIVGSTLLLNVFFSRLLGAAGSGELYYIINNYSIITLIASLSLESAMIYYVSKNEIDDRQLLSFSLAWALAAGCLTLLSMLYLQHGGVTVTRYNNPLNAVAFVTGTLLTTYISALFFARHHFVLPFLVPAAMNVIIVCYGWLLFILQRKVDAEIIILMYFLGLVCAGLALIIAYHFMYGFPFAFHWPAKNIFKKLFAYSSLAFGANIISFLAYRIDYWILKRHVPEFVTMNALGNYIQVAKIVQLFLFVPTVIATVLFPASAAETQPYFDRRFKAMIGSAVLMNVCGCILLVIAGRWAFALIFGTGFSGMYMCFICSIPAILAITIVRVLASWFAGVNMVRYNLVGGVLALIVISSLNLLLIPGMGINGAALADSAGYTVFLIFLLLSFHSKMKRL